MCFSLLPRKSFMVWIHFSLRHRDEVFDSSLYPKPVDFWMSWTKPTEPLEGKAKALSLTRGTLEIIRTGQKRDPRAPREHHGEEETCSCFRLSCGPMNL